MQRKAFHLSLTLLSTVGLLLLMGRANAQYSHAYLVWGNAQNGPPDAISIWSNITGSNSTGNPGSIKDWGPFPGWTPRGGSRDPNGGSGARVFWGMFDSNNNPTGQWSLWNMTSASSFSYTNYSLPAGWKVQGMSAAGGFVFVLWQNQNTGQMSLWKKPDNSNVPTILDYGPFTNWKAEGIAAADANTVFIAWVYQGNNANFGQVSLWKVDLTNTNTNTNFTYHNYGPFPGWVFNTLDLQLSTGQLYMLWDNEAVLNGGGSEVSLWKLNSDGTFSGNPVNQGPFSGWYVNNMSTGTDGVLVLWSDVNGRSSLWNWNIGNNTITWVNDGPFNTGFFPAVVLDN